MSSIARRLRQFRDKIGYSQDGIAASVGMKQRTWADWERQPPQALLYLRALSEKHGVSTDYLLDLTDNPLSRADTPIPDTVLAVMELAVDMSPARQDELLAHARVLIDAQRAANLSEYDRMLAMFAASEDGPELVEMVEDLLRAVTAGDTTRAQRLLVGILAGRGEDTQESEQ